jgi:RNA polymerase sigma factor (sigma-70 family)
MTDRPQADAVPSTPDLELIRRIARQDRQAFEAFYRLYYRRVFQFVVRIVRQEAMAEEIVSDVMFAVWRGAGTFAGASSVSTWVLGVAYRQCLKTLDKNRKHSRLDNDEELVADAVDCDPASDPAWAALAHSEGKLLEQAMAALGEHHRVVVELTATGHSYGEIATIVGCCENTVKTRMFHARLRLKQFLAGIARGELSGDSRFDGGGLAACR